MAQSRARLQEAAGGCPDWQMLAKGKQQQLRGVERGWHLWSCSSTTSSEVDSFLKCSRGQWVEKLVLLDLVGPSTQGLGPAFGFSTNAIRVLISMSHTGLGCRGWRVCPSLPPRELHSPATSPVTRGAGCPSRSALPALVVACWDHTLSSLFLLPVQSEPDGTPDQCPHMSIKRDECSLHCGPFLRDNGFSHVT